MTKHSKCVNHSVYSLAVNTREDVKLSVSCQTVRHMKGADMRVNFSQNYLQCAAIKQHVFQAAVVTYILLTLEYDDIILVGITHSCKLQPIRR